MDFIGLGTLPNFIADACRGREKRFGRLLTVDRHA